MAPIYFAFNCTDMEISMKNFLNVACLLLLWFVIVVYINTLNIKTDSMI